MDAAKTTVLVTGASGMVGQPVACELIEQGFAVKVAGRNAEKLHALYGNRAEAVHFDLADSPSMERALEGVDAVHISLHGPAGKKHSQVEPEGIRRLASLAEDAGVKAMSYTSGATVGDEEDTFYVTRGKLETENLLLECAVPTTVFRPSWFMETLDLLVRGKNAMMAGRMPNLLHPVAGRDYGRMVAKAYRDEAGFGIYYVYGPQAMTMTDALTQVLEAKAPDGKINRLSPFMIGLLKLILSSKAAYGFDLMEHFQHTAEPVHPGPADEIFGRNTTTLVQWLAERYGTRPVDTDPEEDEESDSDDPGDGDDDEQVFELPLKGGK